jgi:hypothetical protein
MSVAGLLIDGSVTDGSVTGTAISGFTTVSGMVMVSGITAPGTLGTTGVALVGEGVVPEIIGAGVLLGVLVPGELRVVCGVVTTPEPVGGVPVAGVTVVGVPVTGVPVAPVPPIISVKGLEMGVPVR